jgi:hypothetical protein
MQKHKCAILKQTAEITGMAQDATAVSAPLSQGIKISNEYAVSILSLFSIDQDADIKPANINLSNKKGKGILVLN